MDNPTWVTITHQMMTEISEDGRAVKISRESGGGIQFEWIKPDSENGSAMISTRIALSQEAFLATMKLGLHLIDRLEQEEEKNG